MKWFTGIAFIFCTFHHLQLCLGFKVDESCRRPFGHPTNDYKMIQKAMRNAFTMAQWALDEVEKDGKDRDPQVNRLIRILFCRKGEDPKKAALPHLTNTLKGVLSMRGQTPHPDNTDVVVYCNHERITSVKRTLHSRLRTLHYDEHSKTMLDGPGDTLTECISKRSVGLAVTMNPTRKDMQHGGEIRLPSQIQICRWFLEWSRDARYKVWDDISKRAASAHLGIRWSTKGWPLTEVDAWTLLDKVMLHELTHTTSALRNVDCHKGFHFPRYPYRAAYGWRASRALAKKKGYPYTVHEVNENIPKGQPGHTRPVVHKAETNADSIALFGSAINLLRRRGGPKYIKLNGELTLTPPDHNEGGNVDDLIDDGDDDLLSDGVERDSTYDGDSFQNMLEILERDYNREQATSDDESSDISDENWSTDEDFELDDEFEDEDTNHKRGTYSDQIGLAWSEEIDDPNSIWTRSLHELDEDSDTGHSTNHSYSMDMPLNKPKNRLLYESYSDDSEDLPTDNAEITDELDQQRNRDTEAADFLTANAAGFDEPDQEGDYGAEFAGIVT